MAAYFRGLDDLVNTVLSQTTTTKAVGKQPQQHNKKRAAAVGGDTSVTATSTTITDASRPFPPSKRRKKEEQPSTSRSKDTPAVTGTACTAAEDEEHSRIAYANANAAQALRNKDKVKASELRIKNALSEIVLAAKERSEALLANSVRNKHYDKKDNYFNRLKCAVAPTVPTAVIGNNVRKASKRNELDTAVRELDVKNKCAMVYDEKTSLEYFATHETVILQMAVRFFSRHNNTKCNGISVSVKADISNRCTSKVVVKNDSCSTTTTQVFEIQGIPKEVMENNFALSKDLPTSSMKPTDRINLDTTKAEASHVFSTLHRLDPKRKLFFTRGTFYQRKQTFSNKFRWTEVVGWEESEASRQIVKSIKPSPDDIFFLPVSFQDLTDQLTEKYSDILHRNTTGKNKRSYYRAERKLVNPQIDAAREYKEIVGDMDRCLDVLLALGKNKFFTKSTVNQYRSKFRRYLVFCFAFYALNRERHANVITPLPFNFFNLFSYMYCHGKKLHSSSFLTTLTFLQNHLFATMSTAAPAVSAKRLLDVDFSVMRGGKGGSNVREFGSPVKTSLHTRTLVSFLGYAEMAMGSTAALLTGTGRRLSSTLAERVANSLERWCDAIIFVFFTFILFHRFSGVKRVSLESALRLIMGQTHAHTNKVRAVKRIRIENKGEEGGNEGGGVCGNEGCATQGQKETGITLSHPHLLGLPFSVQAAIGIPVSKINPLMTACSGGVDIFDSGKKYVLGDVLGVTDTLEKKFPCDGEAAGHLGMFENLVKEMIDDYYGDGSFSTMVSHTKKTMENNAPYNTSSGLLSRLESRRGEDEHNQHRRHRTERGKVYALNRDVDTYLMDSPMKMVFLRIFDEKLTERFLSVGDLALIAVWCKKSVLSKDWDSPALSSTHYDWLGSKVCKNLLLADLVNFGTWGDLKIVNKLDTNTNVFHRDNERLPTICDQKKFVKSTSLENRKKLALLHSCVNVRTRTHLGRVTATSWAVDALRTFTRGDNNMFAHMAASLDLHHLGHTNSANFVPYFSKNYVSNEQEMGLWGYVRRTSEKLAKEELSKGRLGDLDKAGIAKSNVAAAAIAIASTHDMGEVQAVLDEAAKVRKASGAVSLNSLKVQNAREKTRAAGVNKLIRKLKSENNIFLLKELWSFFADPRKRERLMAGEPISAVCPYTGFLHAAVPDYVIDYVFDRPSSCFKLRLHFLDNESDINEAGSSGGRQTANSSGNLVRHNDDAVLTLDDEGNVMTFDKFAMTNSEEAKRKMREQDQQSMIAARIKKVCDRNKRKNNADDDEAREQLLRELEGIAYLA